MFWISEVTLGEVISSLEREDVVRKERVDLEDRSGRDSGMEGHGVYWGSE